MRRNIVERAFARLRQHRAVATRYDKRDFVWRGTVDAAPIGTWLRTRSRDLRDTVLIDGCRTPRRLALGLQGQLM